MLPLQFCAVVTTLSTVGLQTDTLQRSGTRNKEVDHDLIDVDVREVHVTQMRHPHAESNHGRER